MCWCLRHACHHVMLETQLALPNDTRDTSVTNACCWAREQGHLNYLFYTGRLGVPALAQPRGHGAVNTVGYGYISVSTVGGPVSAGHVCTHV